MNRQIDEILSDIEKFHSKRINEIEEFRVKLLSKKGVIGELFNEFRKLPVEEKKLIGQRINLLKQVALDKVNSLKAELKLNELSADDNDYTKPATPIELGSRHPVSIVRNEIIEIFNRLGFTISVGPEIEDDWHVFSALGFPPEHPARDMQDTFFIQNNPDILLRTHTSSVQVHVMETSIPPIRTISPGRVFRNEAISARSHCIFHQVEGLYIDKGVSFADLKQTLLYFAKEMFGENTDIRLRPSYFPFTEPSAEMDITCSICGGEGCKVCKYSGWLEILGCGMVDPEVLKSSDINPDEFTGFAFGMGIERIAMLRFQIKDIRYLFENDIRFLKQFSAI